MSSVVPLLAWMLAPGIEYEVLEKPPGEFQCNVVGKSGLPTKDETMTVSLTAKAPKRKGKKAPKIVGAKLGKQTELGTTLSFSKSSAGTGRVDLTVFVDDAKGKRHETSCDTQEYFATQESAGAGTPLDATQDTRAAIWWRDHGKQVSEDVTTNLSATSVGHPFRNQLRRRDVRNAVLLVHLPSGAPASPFPSSVREGTVVQVAVLRPRGDTARAHAVEVKSCASIEPFRVSAEALATDADVVNEQGDPSPELDLPPYELVPIGPWLRCGAGELEYDIEVTDPPTGNAASTSSIATTTKIRVRPVYHLAVVAVPGFDMARLPSYGLRPADDGNGGTRQIIEGGVGSSAYGDRAGASLMIGGQWMIGGIDYEDLRWYNYFANVFVAVNAAKPLDGFVSGLAITPTGGISLAVGLSVHKTQQLGNDLRLGDTFTGEGEIPTTPSWREPSLGAFIGLAIDHRVYEALRARFRASKSK